MEFLMGHTALLAGVLLVVIWYVASVLLKSTSKLPGPPYTKWTGLRLTYHWLRGERASYVNWLHKQYGPIVRIAPNDVSIVDKDAVKTIYSTKETYKKPEFYRDAVINRVENIFTTGDVKLHRRIRRLLANPMSETSLKGMTVRVRDRAELTMEKMKEEMDRRGAADVFKWWLFMATDVIGELTFGDSFRMLEHGKMNEYSNTVSKSSVRLAIRSSFPTLMKYVTILPIRSLRTAQKEGLKLLSFASQSINRYKNLIDTDPDVVKQTLFTKVFKAEDDEIMTLDEIRANSLAYLVAGSDTTANTLTFLIWHVCKRPEIKKNLVQELRELSDDFEETDLRTLPYMNRVIEESLRLYGAVQTGLPRAVPSGGNSFLGYYLDSGTIVSCPIYTLHRLEEIFPDAEEFKPDRWEQPTQAMKDAFMPFGKGARNCIGLHLARIELRLGVALFFRKFPHAAVSSLEGMSEKDMKPEFYFIMNPAGRRCLIQEQ